MARGKSGPDGKQEYRWIVGITGVTFTVCMLEATDGRLVTAGAPCVGVCLSLCVFVWFSACEVMLNVSAPGTRTQSRPGGRGRDSRSQRPRSPHCPSPTFLSHPPTQHHHLRSAALALPIPESPLIGWEEEEEGGYRVPLSGWQHFQARPAWRARPQI